MTCAKQLYIFALRTGFEDIQAALEKCKFACSGKFVDLLEKIHRSLGEVGGSTFEYIALIVG
jgi:hypothetical protein